jgi:long-chain acyl-CoA synthetase
MNIADSLRNHARRRPKHPAVVARDRVVSYAAFDAAVDRAANLLRDAGILQGEAVGLALGDTPEHLAFLMGIARLGAVILPVDRRWTTLEKERIAEHFGARLLIAERADEMPPSIPVLVLEQDLFEGPSAPPPFEPRPASGPDLPLAFSLSSGTTGRPKGPLITHGNLYARFLIYYVTLTLNEHDRFACASPLYFGGSRGFSLCVLYAGGTVVLVPPPITPAELIREVNGYGCTSAFIVPTVIRRLADAHQGEGRCFPDLRVLISTGAALFPEDRALALERVAPNIINFYGSTEGGGISALTTAHPPEKSGSAGAIVFGTEVRVVDEDFRDKPQGEVGRICYRSPGTASAFFNDPEATAAAFRDGWYLPGDVGYLDDEGFLYITGREKDMIIRGGVNIYPYEIESILLTHPAVAEAAVVDVPSAEFGEEIAAFVSARKPMRAEELAAFCAGQLASYKVPRFFEFVTDLPRTSVGKIDKQALKRRLEPRT